MFKTCQPVNTDLGVVSGPLVTLRSCSFYIKSKGFWVLQWLHLLASSPSNTTGNPPQK